MSYDHENECTIPSPTFKVEENEVPLFFGIAGKNISFLGIRNWPKNNYAKTQIMYMDDIKGSGVKIKGWLLITVSRTSSFQSMTVIFLFSSMFWVFSG